MGEKNGSQDFLDSHFFLSVERVLGLILFFLQSPSVNSDKRDVWVFRIGHWKEKATVSILRLIPMAFIHFGGPKKYHIFLQKMENSPYLLLNTTPVPWKWS